MNKYIIILLHQAVITYSIAQGTTGIGIKKYY